MIGNNQCEPVQLHDRLSGENYLIFLGNTLPDLSDNIPLNIRQALCFVHDGCHTNFNSNGRHFCKKAYEDRRIEKEGPVA